MERRVAVESEAAGNGAAAGCLALALLMFGFGRDRNAAVQWQSGDSEGDSEGDLETNVGSGRAEKETEMKKSTKNWLAPSSILLLSLFAFVPLTGCDRDEGPLEEAAEDIEDAADDVKDAFDG